MGPLRNISAFHLQPKPCCVFCRCLRGPLRRWSHPLASTWCRCTGEGMGLEVNCSFPRALRFRAFGRQGVLVPAVGSLRLDMGPRSENVGMPNSVAAHIAPEDARSARSRGLTACGHQWTPSREESKTGKLSRDIRQWTIQAKC